MSRLESPTFVYRFSDIPAYLTPYCLTVGYYHPVALVCVQAVVYLLSGIDLTFVLTSFQPIILNEVFVKRYQDGNSTFVSLRLGYVSILQSIGILAFGSHLRFLKSSCVLSSAFLQNLRIHNGSLYLRSTLEPLRFTRRLHYPKTLQVVSWGASLIEKRGLPLRLVNAGEFQMRSLENWLIEVVS